MLTLRRQRFAARLLIVFLCELKASPMSMVGFPLLLVPFAIYNIIAFLMPSVSFTDPLVRLKLVSGAEWPIALSDVLVTLGILLLLLEVMKGARPGGKYLTDHLLSLLVFGGSAAEFVLWPKFGTSTYFLLVLLALVDFLSGIVLRGRRATRTQPRAAVARADATVLETPPGEARVEPVPAPVVAEAPSAASVAESVLMDHPEPKAAQPAVTASEPAPVTVTAPASTPAPAGEPSSVAESEPSPQIPSPDLQPGSGAAASPETPKH
jgi:hypothetical protein